MSSFAEFKDDINRTVVSAELLGEVMAMYAEIGPEERGFESRAIRVVKLLTDKGHDKKCGQLAAAIIIRLMALDAILADKEVQGWTLPSAEPGVSFVHSNILRAAAEEAIMEGSKGQPIFDAANFRRRVLQIAATGGRA